VVQSLVGKVSGLQINKSSNGVNGTSSVLRGSRSITGNNEALVVIDNAISSSTVLQQLPPELIASVNVIKGCKAQLFMENKV
jgi:outer membrane cobalamin receptor